MRQVGETTLGDEASLEAGSAPSRRATRPSHVVTRALAAAVIALGVVVALTLTDHATVGSAHALSHVTLGRPWGWLSQDQGSLDPPFPWTTSFGSPLEQPTHVHAGALALDVAVVWLALAVLGAAVARLRRPRRS